MRTKLFDLLCVSFALYSLAQCQTTKSLVLCTTLLGGSSKNPVPTRTIALTVRSTATAKETFTPAVTVTPTAPTITATETVTLTSTETGPQVTGTFTTLSLTIVDGGRVTSVYTNTLFTTITETISRTPPATTIPTSPGFTPAASQTGNPIPALKLARRELEARAPSYRTTCVAGPDGKATFTPRLYPTQVLCGVLYQVIATTTKTFTASTTATVTDIPPPPSSTTTTISVTITDTVIPADATVTSTITSTFTNIGTSISITATTSTITSTQTLDLPIPTFYAACGPDNIISSVNGANIVGIASNNQVSLSRFSTPYDCCVSCITSQTCAAGLFIANGATCYLVAQTRTCDPKVEVLRFQLQMGAPGGNSISTGNCGAVANGGLL
ncbi:MAG: hypothetical protein Q9176_001420 [Flavoplaca citrina]